METDLEEFPEARGVGQRLGGFVDLESSLEMMLRQMKLTRDDRSDSRPRDP